MKDLVQMGIDIYKGNTAEFSASQANDKFREKLLEVCGTDKIDYKTFRRHQVELFEIIEETLSVLVVEGLEDQFSEFAETRNLGWGDTNVFHLPNHDLFKVAQIADGTGNLRRQRIDNGTLTVDVDTWGVKIYEELYRFLAGRIDWADMVNRVAKSYSQKIATAVYDALYASYDELSAPYKVTSNGEALVDALTKMASHVEAATGADVRIIGTKSALAKIDPQYISDGMKDERNELGYFGKVNGYDLQSIKQAHKAGTDEFAIADDFLMVVPEVDNKMVKIVNEGDALIEEVSEGRSDKQKEYEFIMKMGLAVISTAKYGVVKLG